MQNAVCTLSARLKPAEKGISFPWVLFIISSPFLASWCVRKASNHHASVEFIKESVDAFHNDWQINTLHVRNGSGGECRH